MMLENAKNRNCENGRIYSFSGIILFAFLSLFSFSVYGQDTDNMEFWFVVPDAAQAHDDRPTFLMITTGDKPATVTVSMPAAQNEFESLFSVRQREIPANSYWKFEFDTDEKMALIENAYTSSGTVTRKGILIESTAPVSAYYQIDGSKSTQKEIFTLKGKKALGIDFYMPFQENYKISNNYSGQGYRQIQIVASENNTMVTIHPRGQAVFKSENGTINASSSHAERTIELQRGQTLLWCENERNKYQISGTQITSTPGKPIAITLFEDCVEDAEPKSVDPIGDQMVPVNHLGQNYIVVKGYSYTNYANEHAIIVAVENDTRVWLNSNDQTQPPLKTLSRGEYYSIDLGREIDTPGAYYITTSKPAYCMHQSAAESEIGGALLPSLYSISGRNITFIKGPLDPTNPNNINAMFLVFRESAQDGFTLDGNSLDLSSDIQDVGFDDWKYAKVTLSNTTGREQVCTVKNDKGSFALGYFTGNTSTSLYGYLSAFGTFSFESDTIYACHSHIFDAPYALRYDWMTPEGPKNVSRFETTKSGQYILEVNQDPYTLKDTTYLKVQNFSHILNAPGRLLVDKSYNFSIQLNPDNHNDNRFNAAYEWNFGDGASIETSGEREVTVSYSTPGSKRIKLQVFNLNAICDTIIYRDITIVDASEGQVMYWKSNTSNRDWNDVNNWAKDAVGTPIFLVPAKYTRVYLPGYVEENYPSLKDDRERHTDWTHYGQPEAGEIVFRYGSELHYQHKLKYEKAYVNYNWGYYDEPFTQGQAEQQPFHSLEHGKKLARNTWHMLAAPLKSMVSGDFSLAGHPFSWQQQFRVVTSLPEGSVTEADFSKPFPKNDIPLAGNNNAIAVKMAWYKNETGYRQDYLQGLTGVIDIPYFERDSLVQYYPAHSYDALSQRSYFYYYDTKTLRIITSPKGSMKRAGEAYRFIYEDANGNPPSDGIYKADIAVPEGATEVMVGNPLLAPIVSSDFLVENENAVDENYGYKLLSEDGETWEHYNFTAGNLIPAWKAFIVTLKEEGVRAGSGGTATLRFLLGVGSMTASVPITPVINATRSSNVEGMAVDALYLQVLKSGTRSGDAARLGCDSHGNKPDIRKMILPEGHRTPEVFFISADGKSSNLIQQYRQGEKEVVIGVKTSDVTTRLSLEFGNIAAFSASTGASVVLVDKHQNTRQDLSRNPVYSFTQQASGLDNQYVDRHRFVLQLGSNTGPETEEDVVEDINIMYRSGILEVTSYDNIHTVSVYDLHGRQLFSVASVNQPRYSRAVPVQGKMYLVRVKTVSGKEKVRKIVAN